MGDDHPRVLVANSNLSDLLTMFILLLSKIIKSYIEHYFDSASIDHKISAEATLMNYLRTLPAVLQLLILSSSIINSVPVLLCKVKSKRCGSFCTNSPIPTISIYILLIGIMSWRIKELENEV